MELIVSGERFGRLTALHEVERSKLHVACLCDCGKETTVSAAHLRSGHTKSCGCLHKEIMKNRYRFDLKSGMVFGRLTVKREIDPILKPYGSFRRVECVCVCGAITTPALAKLTSGHTLSCGCLKREQARNRKITHGHSIGGKVTPELHSYQSMRGRCLNKNDAAYSAYGGRGIEICKRWLHGDESRSGFECFLADMGERPSKLHSLDRIDSNGNYEPDNCRWATKAEQARNRRSNHYVMVGGVSIALSEACERFDADPQLVRDRLRRGWTFERAVAEASRAR